MSSFVKLLIILSLIYATEAQVATCDYNHGYNWHVGYKTRNSSYYTCYLDTRRANYDEKLTRIDGQHVSGHTDADVEWLRNYRAHKLKTFTSFFCQKYPNLRAIDMAEADMESIEEDSLSNCQHLDRLFIHKNKIRALPERLLFNNVKLTAFGIDNNLFKAVPSDFLANQNNLEDLFLSHLPISQLPSNIFRSLVKLEVLYLVDNNFRAMDPEWFANLHNLRWLGVDTNLIAEVPSKCFASLRNLQKLWLQDNRISSLSSNSFEGLQSLKTLILDTNEISELPVGVFTYLKNLEHLSLKNNKLMSIHSDSFGVHDLLTKIELANNKISSIDPKFIDNTAALTVSMTSNICSSSMSQSRAEVRNNLRNCFANYRSNPVHHATSCGRAVMPQGNIIGGDKIKLGSYPWIAALMTPSGQFFCGGILVSNRKVVTAAHCIQNKGDTRPLLPRSVVVLLGFHDLSISIEVGRVPYAVQAINIHPDWNTQTTSYDADIAVLMLSRDVTFNEYIQPICMTSSDSRIAAMTEGAVVGNGKGGEANEYEPIPKILKMPIQTAQHCTEKDYTFRQLLTGRTFCAGSGNGQGVCTGDSGSGFIVKIGTAFYLRGVVSASLANSYLGCDVDSYSVFTDALKFISWIDGLRAVPADDSDRIIFAS